VDLSTKPIYQALSYEWKHGSTEGPIIYMNGLPHMVRHNLHQALLRFRLTEHSSEDVGVLRTEAPRYLWVDALCIDQNNIGERNHQVQLMGHIYRNATDVLVWLGSYYSDYPGIEWVFSTLKRLPNLHTIEPGSNILSGFGYSGFSSFHVHKYLLAWFKGSYWRRMWIVQEVQLARNLHIYSGRAHMPWSVLMEARKYFIKENNIFKDLELNLF
ncbi:HET-domain-containing protein, partial [Hyaloscypha hepaticicola]